jgi:FMN-dependent NADH-azoreductase
MAKILIIKGHINNDENSVSERALQKFLSYYKDKNSNDEFEILDLNNESMAAITLTSHNRSEFWTEETSDKYIEQLKNVDKVIMVTSMVNFLPAPTVRNYFDHVMVANKTFTYKYVEKGRSKGLLDHLKVQLIFAQGSPVDWYPFSNLKEILTGEWGFIGAEVSDAIVIDGAATEKFKTDGGAEGAIERLDSEIKSQAEKF